MHEKRLGREYIKILTMVSWEDFNFLLLAYLYLLCYFYNKNKLTIFIFLRMRHILKNHLSFKGWGTRNRSWWDNMSFLSLLELEGDPLLTSCMEPQNKVFLRSPPYHLKMLRQLFRECSRGEVQLFWLCGKWMRGLWGASEGVGA